jgi:hypothetical protein
MIHATIFPLTPSIMSPSSVLSKEKEANESIFRTNNNNNINNFQKTILSNKKIQKRSSTSFIPGVGSIKLRSRALPSFSHPRQNTQISNDGNNNNNNNNNNNSSSLVVSSSYPSIINDHVGISSSSEVNNSSTIGGLSPTDSDASFSNTENTTDNLISVSTIPFDSSDISPMGSEVVPDTVISVSTPPSRVDEKENNLDELQNIKKNVENKEKTCDISCLSDFVIHYHSLFFTQVLDVPKYLVVANSYNTKNMKVMISLLIFFLSFLTFLY